MNGAEKLIDTPRHSEEVDIDLGDEALESQKPPLSRASFLPRITKVLTLSRLLILLPSPFHSLFLTPRTPKHVPRPTAWLDGIRGWAAVVVFIEHLSLAVQDSYSMERAYGSPSATSFWQLPFIRLFYDGSPMVPIFFIVSGCALSLKPLLKIHREEWQDFGTVVSSATFRRAFRLFLPSAAVSFLAMLFTQMGIYSGPYPFMEGNAHQIDPPQILPNIVAQFTDWLNWVTTQLLYSDDIFKPLSWTTMSNYGFQLWTISTEFYASIALFITLVGLAQLGVWKRQFLIFCLCSFAFYIDRWDIACFIAGISVTELFIQPKTSNKDRYKPMFIGLPTFNNGGTFASYRSKFRQYGYALLLAAGMFIASYPPRQASENVIYRIFSAVVDNYRFWESIGAIFIIISSSQLKFIHWLLNSALSRYLGRVSYSAYLTHVIFLNAFGWRVIPWVWKFTGDEGWWSRQGGFAIGLVICSCLIFWIADLWMRAVDEPCVRFAKRVEEWATSK